MGVRRVSADVMDRTKAGLCHWFMVGRTTAGSRVMFITYPVNRPQYAAAFPPRLSFFPVCNIRRQLGGSIWSGVAACNCLRAGGALVAPCASQRRLPLHSGERTLSGNHMATLFWICVGIVIGWNMPQPAWARDVQRRVVSWLRSLGNQRPG